MNYRTGFVGLVGLPNAGKSSFLNRMLGEKLCGVSAKPQTTRRRLTGIVNDGSTQAIFVDAPGQVSAKKGLNQFLEQEFLETLEASDVLMGFFNLDEENPEKFEKLIEILASSGKPWLAIITKTDLPLKRRSPVIKTWLLKHEVPVFEFGKKTDIGSFKSELLGTLSKMLPESPGLLYPEDQWTTQSLREITLESLGEVCFQYLHQEIPYELVPRILRFEEERNGRTHIFAELVVGKESHRPMVVGRSGQTIKKIGTETRRQLERALGKGVHLDLHVKLRPGWHKSKEGLKEFGYELR